MPPHCDSMDGPVVKAARAAFAARDVRLVLPFVPKAGELEVIAAFDKVTAAIGEGGTCREVAELYFFETVVRIHRAGEGAPFTGLKPAGLSEGAVISLAEAAVESGSAAALVKFLSGTLKEQVERKLDLVVHLKPRASGTVDEGREYVETMLGFVVNMHALFECLAAEPREAQPQHGKG